MTNSEPQQNGPGESADSAPSPGKLKKHGLGMRRLLTGSEEVPRVWGLSLVACWLGGLCGLGVLFLKFHQSTMKDAELHLRQQALNQAVALGQIPPNEDVAELTAAMTRLRTVHDLDYCMVVSLDEVIVAHSDASQIGRKSQLELSSDFESAGSALLKQGDRGDAFGLQIRLVDPDGTERGVLAAGGRLSAPIWNADDVALLVGEVALASLVGLLVLYRLLRRMLRPLSRIRDRLGRIDEDLERRLLELRIADEGCAITKSWNDLLNLTEHLRTDLRSAESKNELADALRLHSGGHGREVLEWLPDGVLVVDEFGQVNLINKACRSLARVADESPVGKPVASLSRNEDLNEVIARLASSPKGSRTTLYHTLVEDGISSTLSVSAASMGGDGGEKETLLVFRDASQQKQAEKARDDFLNQVTHEFRTPLANIRAYTETLMEGILEDKDAQRECLNVINSEAHRLGRLVEEVLTASQLEVGTARLRLASVDLARLLQHSAQDLQGIADEKNIELKIKLPPKVPKIQADKDRLAVVLNNLLGNAIKYSPERASVSLECECSGRNLEISVTDSGMGISEEDLPRIFEKFFRSSMEDVQNLPGTGLGLATARQVARLHGGEITAESELGKGSKFTLTLPVYDMDMVHGG